jgi:uncharacterized protein (DUF3084 family)
MESAMLAASADLGFAQAKLLSAEEQTRTLEEERRGLNTALGALRAEKSQMENSVAQLRSETEQLKKGLSEMKESRVVAFQGELLAQTFIEPGDGGVTGEMAGEAMETLVSRASEYLRGKADGANGPPAYARPVGPISVVITDDVRRAVASQLSSARGRRALRFTAPSNVVEGQVVEGMVSIHDSRLVFRKDEELMAETISGDLGQNYTTDRLYTLLKRVNRRAVALGVMPDPLTGNVGNLGSIEFYEMVDRINESSTAKVVKFVAEDDIYTEGPVELRIEIEERG